MLANLLVVYLIVAAVVLVVFMAIPGKDMGYKLSLAAPLAMSWPLISALMFAYIVVSVVDVIWRKMKGRGHAG